MRDWEFQNIERQWVAKKQKSNFNVFFEAKMKSNFNVFFEAKINVH